MKFDLEIAFCPQDLKSWRNWLSDNHLTQASVWVIFYKKNTKGPYISWSDAVDQAICFGWIDSTRKSLDEERFAQLYTKRKVKSAWSKVNKEKVNRLEALGLITEAGKSCIEEAKRNGAWNAADEIENLVIPDELNLAFQKDQTLQQQYDSYSKSTRKYILHWLTAAKRVETKAKRLQVIVETLKSGKKPTFF